jgi:hypothetical protein
LGFDEVFGVFAVFVVQWWWVAGWDLVVGLARHVADRSLDTRAFLDRVRVLGWVQIGETGCRGGCFV